MTRPLGEIVVSPREIDIDDARRGRKVPDLVIAACAEDHGMTVAHYDRDFEHIATVTGQDTMWIVPPGTVD